MTHPQSQQSDPGLLGLVSFSAPNEEWRKVSEGAYSYLVSNLGRVATVARIATGTRKGKPITQTRPNQLISPWVGKNGYLLVSQMLGGVRTKHLVHRLVAKAFVPGIFDDATVNHIDGNKLNNNASNLEWVTRGHNTHLQWKAGLVDLRGKRHPSAKLNAVDVRMIADLIKAGHPSTSIATRFNVSSALVCKIGRGEKLDWPDPK